MLVGSRCVSNSIALFLAASLLRSFSLVDPSIVDSADDRVLTHNRMMVTHDDTAVSMQQSALMAAKEFCIPNEVRGGKKRRKVGKGDFSNASKQLISNNLEVPALSNVPQNLEFDKKTLTAKVLGIIDREWVALKLNELFVIEFYSRKI